MSVDDALTLSLRRDATARHNATVVVHRVTNKELNASTGVNDPTTTSVYSGACLILPLRAEEQTPEYGGEDVNIRRYKVEVAANADVLPDDIATFSAASLDDDLSGKVMTVVDVHWSSRQVVRTMVCQFNAGG